MSNRLTDSDGLGIGDPSLKSMHQLPTSEPMRQLLGSNVLLVPVKAVMCNAGGRAGLIFVHFATQSCLGVISTDQEPRCDALLHCLLRQTVEPTDTEPQELPDRCQSRRQRQTCLSCAIVSNVEQGAK